MNIYFHISGGLTARRISSSGWPVKSSERSGPDQNSNPGQKPYTTSSSGLILQKRWGLVNASKADSFQLSRATHSHFCHFLLIDQPGLPHKGDPPPKPSDPNTVEFQSCPKQSLLPDGAQLVPSVPGLWTLSPVLQNRCRGAIMFSVKNCLNEWPVRFRMLRI